MADEEFPQEEDRCSICLGPKTDPVYLPCLHTYCRECIMEYIKSRGVMTLEEDLRMQLDNMEPIICPECRNTVFKKRNEELVLPRPTECSTCKRHIHKIVRFPCCGFQNDKTCLRCELREDKEIGTRVKCPSCDIEISASALQALTLCLFCKELKLDREPTCECQGPVVQINNQLIHAILVHLHQQFHIQPAGANVHIGDVPTQEQNPMLEHHVARETENDITASLPRCLCTTVCVIALLLAWILVPYPLNTIPSDKYASYSQESSNTDGKGGVICANSKVWIADRHGDIDPDICRSGTSRATTSSKQSYRKGTENKQTSKEERPDSPITVKKKVPVYQKECYPSAVWLITPEGEIHTKKCEDVLTGYKTVTENGGM